MARLHSIDSLTPSLEISVALQYITLVTCVSNVINNMALALDYSLVGGAENIFVTTKIFSFYLPTGTKD